MKIKRFSKKDNDTLKEINEKLALLEEKEKEAKIREIEGKRSIFKSGISAGAAGTAVGGGMLLSNKIVNDIKKAGKATSYLSKIDVNKIPDQKTAAITLTALGAGTLAAGIAGNRVYKKKIKKVRDDNSEKK